MNYKKIIAYGTAFSCLSPREQNILAIRFGEKKTLEEVGKEFGVTRERIRQIETKALTRLSEAVKSKGGK